jgi:hypothetical protein
VTDPLGFRAAASRIAAQAALDAMGERALGAVA